MECGGVWWGMGECGGLWCGKNWASVGELIPCFTKDDAVS